MSKTGDSARPAVAGELQLRGIGVSPGVAVAPAFRRPIREHNVVVRQIRAGDTSREIARFESALIATRRQLREIQATADPAVAGIFDAHLLILDDRPFIEKIIEGIVSQRRNADAVLADVGREFVQALAKANDNYLRERGADVEDVVRRIQHNLAGTESVEMQLPGRCVLVTPDLTPSEVVALDTSKIVAIVLDLGSPTSHAAIVAGKLGIPAVVGLNDVSKRVNNGETVLVDGNKGLVILRPSQELIGKYDRIAKVRREIGVSLAHLRDEPAETRDGYRVVLSANMELPSDLDAVIESGAEGVGLFRTEYFFMASKELPSEEAQFEAYSKAGQRLAPAPLIIRTLDLGGDKFLSNLDVSWHESNPFMGWRAIRFCLAQPDLFRTQLRAMLRASVYGNIKIMYPMISNVDEIVRANVILDQAKKELMERGHPFNPHLEVGAMIEVPAAAMVADEIAPYVKFFSLGTNDLIQYTLAIDRGNERVAYLYEPTHLAVLRLMKHTIDVGHRFGIWTGLCGGVGGDPLLTPLLIGLGLDEISVNPPMLPVIKDAIRNMAYSEARHMAEAALYSRSSVDIQDLVREFTKKMSPEILELV